MYKRQPIFLPVAKAIGIDPVSYTHLDVYKRQMRKLWDASEAEARKVVVAAGVHFNTCNIPAFRRAAQPLLDDYHRNPAIESLTRRIRALA